MRDSAVYNTVVQQTTNFDMDDVVILISASRHILLVGSGADDQNIKKQIRGVSDAMIVIIWI